MTGLHDWMLHHSPDGDTIEGPTGTICRLNPADDADTRIARAYLIRAAPDLRTALQRLAHASACIEGLLRAEMPIPRVGLLELHDATIVARDALRKAVGL